MGGKGRNKDYTAQQKGCRELNILSLSYGKDSLACLGACELLGWKIDRIVHAEVWATDTIPADLPPMVEFKKKADRIIKERYGVEVEHIRSDNDYSGVFYRQIPKNGKWAKNKNRNEGGKCYNPTGKKYIYGFPNTLGAWCNSRLKVNALKKAEKQFINAITLIGIALDEPNRFHNLDETHKSPLVEIGWTEADAKQWCIENDLLSPIYTDTCMRGGCWFCHNQGVNQLRELRHNYPDLWALLLKWDSDSPVTFRTDGRTVHDFDRRFKAEDEGFINANDRFKWIDLDMQQYNIFHYLNKG